MINRNAYFAKFPIISYNGAPSINIMRRTSFNENVKGYVSAFYPVTLEEGSRIDSLAFDYYTSVDFDWLIYHMNGVVDPYYDVLLSTSLFERYIKHKYGSIRDAQRKTAFYANNHSSDESIISVSEYASLTRDLKKYWTPLISAMGVVGYNRSTEDFTSSTNKIVSLEFEPSEVAFNVGDIIRHKNDATTFAEVVSSNESSCMIQHVRGEFTSGDIIVSEVNAEERELTNVTLITHVIPEDEQVYYSPVSFYQLERDKNDSNRELYLVDRVYTEKLNMQLEKLLK